MQAKRLARWDAVVVMAAAGVAGRATAAGLPTPRTEPLREVHLAHRREPAAT